VLPILYICFGNDTILVPWGKHRRGEVRLSHKAPGLNDVDPVAALPVILIRDPLNWLRSICRSRYATRWMKSKNETHCPNLVQDDDPQQSVPADIVYDKNDVQQASSVLHLWNDWYRTYLYAEYPRLIIRFEDLLFHASSVMNQIATCAGGHLVHTDPYLYHYPTGKSKDHGSGTDYLKAMIKSGDPIARYHGYWLQDILYAAKHVDPDLMNVFQYQWPNISFLSSIARQRI
jgi:hypothetical protein